jgi:hypothetical protein
VEEFAEDRPLSDAERTLLRAFLNWRFAPITDLRETALNPSAADPSRKFNGRHYRIRRPETALANIITGTPCSGPSNLAMVPVITAPAQLKRFDR